MREFSRERPNRNGHLLTHVLDSFNTTIAGLDSSYRELKERIRQLNVQLSEKNKQLEKNKHRGKAEECPEGQFRRCYTIDEDGNEVCPCEFEKSAHPRWLQSGGSTEFSLGDEVDEATMTRLKKLGYTFEKI